MPEDKFIAELTKAYESSEKKGIKKAARDVKNILDDYKKINDLIEGGKSIEDIRKQWKKMKETYWASTKKLLELVTSASDGAGSDSESESSSGSSSSSDSDSSSEDSDSESESSSSSSSSDDDKKGEAKAVVTKDKVEKPHANAKVNGSKVIEKPQANAEVNASEIIKNGRKREKSSSSSSLSDSESDSDSSSSSSASSSSSSSSASSSSDSDSDSSSSSSSSEDEKRVLKKRKVDENGTSVATASKSLKKESSVASTLSDGSQVKVEEATAQKSLTTTTNGSAITDSVAPSVKGEANDYATPNGKGKKQPRKSNTPFQRIKTEGVKFADERLKDNSFAARGVGTGDYGAKASEDLIVTRGAGFRKEKNKKKRGSYKGGEITLQSHSIKFTD